MRKLAYSPGKTTIHKLYPITKFIWLMIASILMFIINNGYILILLAIVQFLLLLLTNPFIWKVRGYRLTLTTGIILLLMYLIFDKSGEVIVHSDINLFTLTSSGLLTGLRVSGRFLTIVFLSYLFILTTDPNHLAYALMKTGLPYRYGFMFVTAIRLAPLMEEEGRNIYQAQLVRGVRYDKQNFSKLILLIRQFMTPLLISAIQRADKLFFSLEGRGFGKYPTRTYRNQTDPSSLDIIISIILIIFFALLLWVNFGGVL